MRNWRMAWQSPQEMGHLRYGLYTGPWAFGDGGTLANRGSLCMHCEERRGHFRTAFLPQPHETGDQKSTYPISRKFSY